MMEDAAAIEDLPQGDSYYRASTTAAEAPQPAEPSDQVMPISDVMALLQATREEQLDCLKSIADGVQQLQSQVMVLGEVAASSEEKTAICLDRLAGLERRIGSIPVPLRPPAGISQQQYHNGERGAAVTRMSTPNRGPSRSPQGSSAKSSPLAWRERLSEPEPARPHFMRNPPQIRATEVDKNLPATAPSPVTAREVPKEAAPMSAEEASTEAKRRAFQADRAAMQARISARQGKKGVATGSTSTSSISSGRPLSEPVSGTRHNPSPGVTASQEQPQVVSQKASSFVGAGPGSFGGSRSLHTAERLEERARQEDERRQQEIHKRAEREKQRREAEEVRLKKELKEAEELRIREDLRRKEEAERQVKTRHIMSSLFDKDEPADGSSLFGGLGAALPAGSSVFDDSDNLSARAGSGLRSVGGGPSFTMASGHTGAQVGGSGSLFAGIDDELLEKSNASPPASAALVEATPAIKTSRGGLMADVVDADSAGDSLKERADRPTSPGRDWATTFEGNHVDVTGDGLLDRGIGGPLLASPPRKSATREEAGGRLFASDHGHGGINDEDDKKTKQNTLSSADDFLASLDTAQSSGTVPIASGGITRGISLFDEDLDHETDDTLSSRLVAKSPLAAAAGDSVGSISGHMKEKKIASTRFLTDAQERNVFGGIAEGLSRQEEVGATSAPRLPDLRDANLPVSKRNGGGAVNDPGKEGMFEVSL